MFCEIGHLTNKCRLSYLAKSTYIIKANKYISSSTGPKWTDCIIDKIFKNIEVVKFITTALKSILILVKLLSLVAKCCKM